MSKSEFYQSLDKVISILGVDACPDVINWVSDELKKGRSLNEVNQELLSSYPNLKLGNFY